MSYKMIIFTYNKLKLTHYDKGNNRDEIAQLH